MRKTHSVFIFIAFLLSLLCLGCDETEFGSGTPLIEVEPEEVHFRTLNRGETEGEVIKVINTGTNNLIINDIQYEGQPEFTLRKWDGRDLSEVEFPDGIPQPFGAIEFKDLSIVFTPDAEGKYTGEVIVLSNAKNDPEKRIPVDGECSVSDIEVEPPMLDFGKIGLNSTASLNLTIKNVGAANLIIAESDFALADGVLGDPDTTPFGCMAKAMEIVKDEHENLEVLYAPKNVEIGPDFKAIPHEDILLIHSNDPDENPVEVPLIGQVDSDLPPLAALKVTETTRLDGTVQEDPCSIAPTDTITLVGRAVDPEGEPIQSTDLIWAVEDRPAGSFREVIPSDSEEYTATFKADLSGEYTICVKARDPGGIVGSYDPAAACSCEDANAKPDDNYDCPCVRISAYPREDLRIELTWENLGPDLDLHLLAPGANPLDDYCQSCRECRFDIMDPENPNWTRTACVDTGATKVCREPNCDAVAAGCQPEQGCYDDGNGPACWWKRCSERDCYWDCRNPDWGVPGDDSDDPKLAIDCTHGCRAENVNLNNPETGTYTIMVNCFEWRGDTRANISIFFKGDAQASHTFTSLLTNPCQGCCDTWNVATIEWIDHENHPVVWLNDSHSDRCCQ